MPVKPHYRMTCQGTLPGNEMFSFGLSLGRIDNGFLSVLLDPDDTIWDDLVDDVVTFWDLAIINAAARLTSVKFAPIGTDGKYTGPPVERLVDVGTGGRPGASASVQPPNQVALAVTLHTLADLGRVKGRFYLPLPGAVTQADGRILEAARDQIETAAGQFVTNINNQPGLDVLNIRCVVASAGRHNSDGSVKLAHDNHEVNAVSVGRVLDTQRRRRNKLTEFRGTPTAIS